MDALDAAKRALSSSPPDDAHLAWHAENMESPKLDEEERAKQIGQTVNTMQQHDFDHHRHAFRATNVETPGIVKGKLTVLSDLPRHFQQGIFETTGKRYDVAARYANESVFLQADQKSDRHGLGLRIFGVKDVRFEGADPMQLRRISFQQCSYDRIDRFRYQSRNHAAEGEAFRQSYQAICSNEAHDRRHK